MPDHFRFAVPVAAVSATHAQTTPAARSTTAGSDPVRLDAFVATGTRFEGRLVTESPVPIDVIAAAELTADGYGTAAHAAGSQRDSVAFAQLWLRHRRHTVQRHARSA